LNPDGNLIGDPSADRDKILIALEALRTVEKGLHYSMLRKY
jgi:hypothetical protein